MDFCESARPSASDDHSPWTLRCDRNYDRLFNIDRRYIVVGADGGKARLLVKANQSSSTIAAAYIRNAVVSNASDDQSSQGFQENSLAESSSQCSTCDEDKTFGITRLSDDGKPRYSSRDSDVTSSPGARSATPPRSNTKSLRGSLSVVLSAMYFIFVVTVGVVIGVADLIVPETNIGEIFSICLLTPGLVWYVALHVDLLKQRNDDVGQSAAREKSNGYTFHRGRHSGSFFLKIGAAGFCFGHLIHSFLMLGRQILHFTSPDPAIRRDCGDVTALILYVLLPVYSFYQLFILFKYSNVMINRWNKTARFGLMHSMATSLFFWFWSVRNETVDSLHHQHLLRDHRHLSGSTASTLLAAAQHDAVPHLTNATGGPAEYGHHDLMRMLWSGAVLGAAERCAGGGGDGDFSALILHVSPYLYPFSIEYSISVVGIWFIMWQNVGKVAGGERRAPGSGRPGGDCAKRAQTVRNNHLVIHADCSSTNRGLFAGLVVLVAVAVSVIVFFLAFSDERYVATGIWIGLVSEFTLLLVMMAATGLAYRQLGRLDVNPRPVSQLDDLLLFVCIPSFFLYGIFSIVPALVYRNYMSLVVVVLQVGQVTLQTPLVISGLRRCSRSAELRASKSGRELVTFLVVCNLSMWIMETLEIKSYETNSDRIHFYGHQLWTLLSHVTLPLTLFYRFHSASCLVDIWKSAYEPPDADDDDGDICAGHREP